MLAAALKRPAALRLVLICALLLLLAGWNALLPRSSLAYLTRPLWDKNEAPRDVIGHYSARKAPARELCGLHGFSERPSLENVQVWDAVIFSTEVDLLHIRLHELNNTVSRFFILEATRTFTGIEKPVILSEVLQKPDFAPFRDKIVHFVHDLREIKPGENPFELETDTRAAMTTLLRAEMAAIDHSPVLIMSDIDEIPSSQTLELLQACDFPSPMHLGMRSYLYSFEFPIASEVSAWRARAVVWPLKGRGDGEYYRHGKTSERVLSDSGWHCSWCFPSLGDFAKKAKGYSHADRLNGNAAHLLAPEEIQRKICRGADIFSMWPEAYTYREFFSQLVPKSTQSAINLPS